MGYILYSVSFTLLVFATVAYFTRTSWLHSFQQTFYPLLDTLIDALPDFIYTRLPDSATYIYSPLPGSSASASALDHWGNDISAGLSSSAFDLTTNIESGDSRSGLDDGQKRQILRIMRRRNVGFDDARTLWMQEQFEREGIGRDGRPRDPKFVSFS